MLSSDGSHWAGSRDILQNSIVIREVRIVTDSSQVIGEAVIKVVAMDIPATPEAEVTDHMAVVVVVAMEEATAVVLGVTACPTWAQV